MQTDLENTILTILEAVLKTAFTPGEDVNRENTPAWDSLKHLEIVFALEEQLEIEFSEQEMASLNSVATIVEAVERKNAP